MWLAVWVLAQTSTPSFDFGSYLKDLGAAAVPVVILGFVIRLLLKQMGDKDSRISSLEREIRDLREDQAQRDRDMMNQMAGVYQRSVSTLAATGQGLEAALTKTAPPDDTARQLAELTALVQDMKAHQDGKT
jgi:hypothetical protein